MTHDTMTFSFLGRRATTLRKLLKFSKRLRKMTNFHESGDLRKPIKRQPQITQRKKGLHKAAPFPSTFSYTLLEVTVDAVFHGLPPLSLPEWL